MKNKPFFHNYPPPLPGGPSLGVLAACRGPHAWGEGGGAENSDRYFSGEAHGGRNRGIRKGNSPNRRGKIREECPWAQSNLPFFKKPNIFICEEHCKKTFFSQPLCGKLVFFSLPAINPAARPLFQGPVVRAPIPRHSPTQRADDRYAACTGKGEKCMLPPFAWRSYHIL